jgi:ankyrin repeat protein
LLNDTIIKGASDTTLLRIAEHFPGLLGHRGDHGRFPVHIACAYGASSDFIYKCVSLYPLTAAAQDNDGRTPFHFLCKSYANSCDDTSMSWDKNSIERRMARIPWILYRKAPSAIIIEDNHGVDVVE